MQLPKVLSTGQSSQRCARTHQRLVGQEEEGGGERRGTMVASSDQTCRGRRDERGGRPPFAQGRQARAEGSRLTMEQAPTVRRGRQMARSRCPPSRETCSTLSRVQGAQVSCAAAMGSPWRAKAAPIHSFPSSGKHSSSEHEERDGFHKDATPFASRVTRCDADVMHVQACRYSLRIHTGYVM